MPSVTTDAQQWQSFILQEIGAGLGSGTDVQNLVDDIITKNIEAIWNAWSDKTWFPRLQYLYAKRHACSILMGQLRIKINKTLGPLQQQYNQYFQNVGMIVRECNSQIDIAERTARANRPPVQGQSFTRPNFPYALGWPYFYQPGCYGAFPPGNFPDPGIGGAFGSNLDCFNAGDPRFY